MQNEIFRKQTILTRPFIGDDGVIRYRLSDGTPVFLVYSIAQQAMWGRKFVERYMSEDIQNPYAESVDIDMLPSPLDDIVAKNAASWIINNVKETQDGGVAWFHEFDFVYHDNDLPVSAPWLSGVGQANMLLACLYWRKYSKDRIWDELARRAVVPFTRKLSTQDGLAFSLDNGNIWFEEYPTTRPAHILNCHLLSLVALQKAARELRDSNAQTAFENGCRALEHLINLYDKDIWTRYDLSDLMFIFLRLVPSNFGKVLLGRVDLETRDGLRIAGIEPSQTEPCDLPISRLAGIDWGVVSGIGDQKGRILPYCQEKYLNNIPEGGTDQNTYLIFQENVPNELWAKEGLRLRMQVYLEGNASLNIQFRDPRTEKLSFLNLLEKPLAHIGGWREFSINISPFHIGYNLPRHYHRLHSELLGMLVDNYKSEKLTKCFRKWHEYDFFDSQKLKEQAQLPKSIFVFVNNKCGLSCKMCDWGEKDLEANLNIHMTQKDNELNKYILINAVKKLGNKAKDTEFFLVGTEPLLYKGTFNIIDDLKELGSKVNITTNGLMLKEKAYDIARAGLNSLNLSIDGPKDVHDQIRGYPGLLEKIIEGVDKLKKICVENSYLIPNININFTISRDNHNRIKDFFNDIRCIEPERVTLSHLNYVIPEIADNHNCIYPNYSIGQSSVRAWRDSLDIDFWKLFWEIEEARKIKWTNVNVVPYCPTPTRIKWYYTKPEIPMGRLNCAAPWYSMQILTDGTIAVLGRCFNIIMGDLKSQDIYDIWYGEKYNEFRNFLSENPLPLPCLRCCGSL